MESLEHNIDIPLISVDELCSSSSSEIFGSSLENSFSYRTDQDNSFDHDCMERSLQMGKDFINDDFDFIDQEDFIMNLEIVAKTHPNSQEDHQNHLAITDQKNSHLKGIQAELMEENSLTDLLLTAAEAVESQNLNLASEMITKLQEHLLFKKENEEEDPFSRLAWFFTQGLHDKICNTDSLEIFLHQPALFSRQPNTMSAFQMLQELSPYVKFAHFTANQAILEATQNEKQVHVIDFDIMDGIQWPPLMVDLATINYSSLKLTAVIVDTTNKQNEIKCIQQTGRRLSEFAESIKLKFIFNHMVISKEDDFEKIEVGHEPIIANCIILFSQLGSSSHSLSLIKTFKYGVRKLCPKITVLVEEELFNFGKNIPSFVEFFFEALHYFSALSDSLLSCFNGGYEPGFREVENEFLGSRVLESVRNFPCEEHGRKLWRERFLLLKGYKRIPLSYYNVSQSKFLVSLFRGGYWVQHENCRLVLAWKSRPLISVSIWVPILKQGERGR